MLGVAAQPLLAGKDVDGPESSDGVSEQRRTWADMADAGATTSASASASPEENSQGASESGSDLPWPGTAQAWLSCGAETACPAEGAHPSVGSEGHDAKLCKPCAFFHTKGCTSGESCLFCHVCPPHEKQDRKKLRRRQCQGLRTQWPSQNYPQQTPRQMSGEWRSEHSRQTSGEWRSVHSRQTSGEWRLEHSRQMSSASAASTGTGWGNSSEGPRHSRQASMNSQTTATDTFSYTTQAQEKAVMQNVMPVVALQPAMQQYVMPPMEAMPCSETAYASIPQAFEQQPLWEYTQAQFAAQEPAMSVQPNYQQVPIQSYERAKPAVCLDSGFSTPEASFAPPIEATAPCAAAVCALTSPEVLAAGSLALPMSQPGPEYYGYCSADGMMGTPLSADFSAEAQAAHGMMPMSPHGSCMYNGVQYAFVPVAVPSPHGAGAVYAANQPWHDNMSGQVQVMPVQAPSEPVLTDAWVPPGASLGTLQHFRGSHSMVVDGPSAWGSASRATKLSW